MHFIAMRKLCMTMSKMKLSLNTLSPSGNNVVVVALLQACNKFVITDHICTPLDVLNEIMNDYGGKESSYNFTTF